jgi:predicted dehydrogenase
MKRVGVGIIGCGDILDAYMIGLRRFGRPVEVIRLADIDIERAADRARRHRVTASGSVDDLWEDDSVEVVVSLTPPKVHHELIAGAAASGKGIYTEKPLSASTGLAREAMRIAQDAGISLGSAPDTFLGSAAQTARLTLDRGDIGDVIAVSVFAPYNRAERRHPNPEFLFQAGAGPLLDIPPYHLTWLVHLLGAVTRVAGLSTRSSPVRRVASTKGEVVEIPVGVDTHVTAILEFRSGAVGTFIGSFDVWSHQLPAIEIYGALGTLSLPHPNWYDGSVRIKSNDDEEWQTVKPSFPPIQVEATEKVRGLGVVDLVQSEKGQAPRASSEMAFHVLEVLEAMQISSDRGSFIDIVTQPDRPAPVSAAEVASWRE